MSLTRLNATKDFAFLTLISEEARDVILKYGIVFQIELASQGIGITTPS